MSKIIVARGKKTLVMADDHLDMLMNPRKLSDDEEEGFDKSRDIKYSGGDENDGSEEEGGDDDGGEEEEEDDGSEDEGDDDAEDEDDGGEDDGEQEPVKKVPSRRVAEDVEDMDPPSSRMSKEEILNTKRDLLYRFDRLEKKGIRIPRRFSMASDLVEMQADYDRLVKDRNADAGIKFQKQILVAVVSGIEFVNRRYDPFDVHLDGWSETVNENLEDYDDVLEELHAKYRGKANIRV